MKRPMSLSASKKGASSSGFTSKAIHPHKASCAIQLSLFENISASKAINLCNSSKSFQPSLFKNLDESNIIEDIKLFNKVHDEILMIVKTYHCLMNLRRLDEVQADILEKILDLSEANPILSEILSIVDENLPISEDEMSGNFSQYLKQKIGDDAYQAWREFHFM